MRFLLASVFLTSSLPKLRHSHAFVSAVHAYHLLPQPWVRPFARTLPLLELTLGLLLLLGWQTHLAALASAALLLVFVAAMGVNIARGRKDLDCGCSGKKHTQKIGWKPITRNLILILLALPLALWGGGLLALDNQPPTVQAFVMETLMLNSLLPLALSGVGLVFLSRLFKQTVRLALLSAPDSETSEVPQNFRSRHSMEVQP